jgi:rSAM/selenodomain-associated transferase 1
MTAAENRLIIFLKAPRAGSVKTRLATTLGDHAALEAYRLLLATTLGAMQPLSSVELRFTPDDAAEEAARLLRPGWTAVAQGPGDLGERLARAFDDAYREGARRVAVIGSDCPDLTAADITEAWETLDESDVVLGPATDGGYWLLASRRPCAFLFRGIPWSSSEVLAATRRRAESAGLEVTLLRELTDVDTEEDWLRWLQSRSAA